METIKSKILSIQKEMSEAIALLDSTDPSVVADAKKKVKDLATQITELTTKV